MNMLDEQIKELHEMADAIYRRSREIGLDYGMGRSLADASRMLREAADTIESLRERLQELQGVTGESNYTSLFGTPERAAGTLEKSKTLCAWCDKQTCSTSGGECRIFEYDALLEWLRGRGEAE